MPLDRPEDIARLLAGTRTIALVGASERTHRPAHGVMRFLQAHGYQVIPVNPRLAGTDLLGAPVVASLSDIAEPVDLVDVFRRPEAAASVVDEAIAIGARAVWLQIGVVVPEAARRAEAAGLEVVMDRCPKIEIARLGVRPVA